MVSIHTFQLPGLVELDNREKIQMEAAAETFGLLQ